MIGTCVNERVAGRRHFSVSGQSPVSHQPYVPGIVDKTMIWTTHEWNDGVVRSEAYGHRFETSEQRDRYLLEHGYIRRYYRRGNETLEETAKRKQRAARTRLRAGLPVSYPSALTRP